MDGDAPAGARGRKMMMRKLKLYLWWKSQLSTRKQAGKHPISLPNSSRLTNEGEVEISTALKKKDEEHAQKTQSRRRIRGGAPTTKSSSRVEPPVVPKAEPKEYNLFEVQGEADDFVRLLRLFLLDLQYDANTHFGLSSLESQGESLGDGFNFVDTDMSLINFENFEEFDDSYGLLTPEETILVRAYSDDTDDRVLCEIKPKFIVMFEPDMDFVRRIEVRHISTIRSFSHIRPRFTSAQILD